MKSSAETMGDKWDGVTTEANLKRSPFCPLHNLYPRYQMGGQAGDFRTYNATCIFDPMSRRAWDGAHALPQIVVRWAYTGSDGSLNVIPSNL